MDQATNRVSPDFVWPTVGRPGFAPIDSIIPDPNQPRKYFGEHELDELAETMKTENGGEQREIVTVEELTAEERKKNPGARYMLKSGERRWRAGKQAGLTMLEIRVKRYVSRPQAKLDMYMLNEGRVGLSEIENARYLVELMSDFKLEKQEELAVLTGNDQVYISKHLALMKLIPEVQALMEPSVPERSRLRMSSALIFSRVTADVQRDFVQRMPKGEGVTTRRQVEWLKAEIAKGGITVGTRTIKPSKLRAILGYFADRLDARVTEISGLEEFNSLFDNAHQGEINDLLGRVKDAQASLNELVEKIVQLSTGTEKPQTKLIPAKGALQAKPVPAKPVTVTEKKPIAPSAHLPPAQRPRAPVAQFPPSPKTQPESTGGKRKEKTVTYYSEGASRKVTDKVTREQYIELWDKGLLGFQVDRKDRPAWMPLRQAAIENWDKFCD